MDILDYMGVSKLSAKVFLKVNYSFKNPVMIHIQNSKSFILEENKHFGSQAFFSL